MIGWLFHKLALAWYISILVAHKLISLSQVQVLQNMFISWCKLWHCNLSTDTMWISTMDSRTISGSQYYTKMAGNTISIHRCNSEPPECISPEVFSNHFVLNWIQEISVVLLNPLDKKGGMTEGKLERISNHNQNQLWLETILQWTNC